MKKGIIGKKIGMTQIFDEKGNAIPVTVIEAGPCVIAQKKTVETDGYNAIQLGFMDIAEKKLTKPEAGRFKKIGASPKKHPQGIPTRRYFGIQNRRYRHRRYFFGR